MKRVSITDIETVVLKNDIKELRDQAHLYFDMLWQMQYVIGRNQAYEYLDMGLGIKSKKTWHMGAFSKHRCRLAIIWSISMLNSLRIIDIEEGREPRFPKYKIKFRTDEMTKTELKNKTTFIPELLDLIKETNNIR